VDLCVLLRVLDNILNEKEKNFKKVLAVLSIVVYNIDISGKFDKKGVLLWVFQ
jgi:hypothetical protein